MKNLPFCQSLNFFQEINDKISKIIPQFLLIDILSLSGALRAVIQKISAS
jgi:hypothetical protein